MINAAYTAVTPGPGKLRFNKSILQEGFSISNINRFVGKVPDTPDPHWQVVDSKGNVYLLQRLDIKGGKVNRTITVPSYVPDISKVQIWCAFAETLLGETSFDQPVM